jgi:DNA-binding IclR family transcriptional regulator
VEGPQTIRYAAKPGKMTPLHSSAIGKAMLGTLERADLEAFCRGRRLERITDNTLTSTSRLIKDIDEGRARGYFVTRGENVTDVMAIARVVRAAAGWLGIAVAGPLPRMETNLHRIVAMLMAACEQIEKDGAP